MKDRVSSTIIWTWGGIFRPTEKAPLPILIFNPSTRNLTVYQNRGYVKLPLTYWSRVYWVSLSFPKTEDTKDG